MSGIYYNGSGGSGGSGIQTVTGNTGGAVGPSAGNINLVGSGAVTVTGNPGTNTLTINSSGGSSTTLVNTASYTVLETDYVLLVDNSSVTGVLTLNFPDTPTIDGKVWTVKHIAGSVDQTNYIQLQSVSSTTLFDFTNTWTIFQPYYSTQIVWSATQGQYYIENVMPYFAGDDNTYVSLKTATDITLPNTSSLQFTGGTTGAVFNGSINTMNLDFNYLSLPATTSSNGQIKIGGNPFLHSYNVSNIFLGTNAGNFSTLTGTQNIGIGGSALSSLTTGSNNIGMGLQALNTSTTSLNSIGIGYQALYAQTTGQKNVCVGSLALSNVLTGSRNISIGDQTGTSYTGTESDNVLLNSTGVVADTNTLRIGQSTGTGTQELNKAFICGINGINVGNTAKIVTMGDVSTSNANQLGTATLTAGSNISITPTANTITIAAIPSPFATTVTSAASVAMAINNAYASSGPSLVTFTLPTATTVGSVVQVMGSGTGGWKINQNSGQQVIFGSLNTTTGTGGSLSSTANGDCVTLVCLGTQWIVNSSVGNISLA